MAVQLGKFGIWGNVPVDDDVVPFTHFDPVKGDAMRSNKAHHYISVVYLEGFTDERGRVQVYRAEKPDHPNPAQPRAIAYENYYYSQKLPAGGQENHRFEDLWQTIETVWPVTVAALEARRISPAISMNTLGMLSIMRVRVPAARDARASLMEVGLRTEMQELERIGEIPEGFQRYVGQFHSVPIGINPQRTLEAMSEDLKLVGDLCFRLGFEVVHNRTKQPFLTSDNPVCVYNPRSNVSSRVPYDYSDKVELIFPLSATMLLKGTLSRRPVNMISRHRDVSDSAVISRYNRTIAQFAYRMSVAKDRSCDGLVKAHADMVPTVSTQTRRGKNGIEIVWRNIFGHRPILSKYIDTPEKVSRFEEKMAQMSKYKNEEAGLREDFELD